MRAVERGVLNGHAQLRRLDDGVLLGVDGVAKLVPRARGDALLFAHALAALNAGADARGRAVVAGGEYALVFDDHRADLAVGLIAAGPGGDEAGHLHKALVPFIQGTCLLFLLSL